MLHTLLYFLALIALSTSPNWVKLNQMPVEVLGFYRLGIASIIMGLWVFFRKPQKKIKFSKTILWAVASGFLFFLHLWTYKYAAKNTSVSNTMIIFSSNPVWASLGALFFFREKISKRVIVSYSLALLGVYTLVVHNVDISTRISNGDWAAVLSAVFYAAYMLAGKKARHYYDNVHYALIQYGTCAFFFGLCILDTKANLAGYDLKSWVAIIGLIAFPTFLGHFSFTYLVKHMNLSLMSCGKLIEPITASIMAYYLFGEKTGPYAWISFSLTAASVLVLFSPVFIKKSKLIQPNHA